MRIKFIRYLFLTSLISLFNLHLIYSQGTNSFILEPNSIEEFSVILDSIITKDYYINLKEDIEIFFTFKIDSLGEVHSAHILKSRNFVEK